MRQRTREQAAARYARRKGTHRSLVHRFVGPRALRRRVCRLVRGATHRLCVARGEAACRGAQEGATTTLSVRLWTHQPAAARCLPASAAAFAPPCWARTARAGAPARALSGSSAARAPAAREVRRTAAAPRRMARRASPRHQEAGARVADCKRHVSAAGGPRRPSFSVCAGTLAHSASLSVLARRRCAAAAATASCAGARGSRGRQVGVGGGARASRRRPCSAFGPRRARPAAMGEAEAHERQLTALFMELKCASRRAARSARVPAQTPYALGRLRSRCRLAAPPRRLRRLRRALSRVCPARRSGFRSVDREQDPDTAVRVLKELGGKMTECKRCAPCASCCRCGALRRVAAQRAGGLPRACGGRTARGADAALRAAV